MAISKQVQCDANGTELEQSQTHTATPPPIIHVLFDLAKETRWHRKKREEEECTALMCTILMCSSNRKLFCSRPRRLRTVPVIGCIRGSVLNHKHTAYLSSLFLGLEG